jgi:hypothetical protein
VRAFLVTDAKSTKQIGLDEAHYRGLRVIKDCTYIYICECWSDVCVCVYNTELFWWGERVPCREKDGPHFPTRNTHHHNNYNQDDDDSTTTSILVVEEGERELGASRSLRWRDVAVHGHVL